MSREDTGMTDPSEWNIVKRTVVPSLPPQNQPQPDSQRSRYGRRLSGWERRRERIASGETLEPRPYRSPLTGKPYKQLKFFRPFIVWDGEGYTDDTGKHHYMMLVASTGDYSLAPKGRSLTTTECFELLLRVGRQNPNCNHVIFAGGYDFNMMLGNLSWQECNRLYSQGYTYFDSYRIEHRHRKSVSIRNRDTDEHIIIYDVWPFFQTSFVKTLAAWQVEGPELNRIVSGKAERGKFVYENHREILRYCKAELAASVRLMEAFREGLRACDLLLNRWDGPGAVAGALFKKHGTRAHQQDMEHSVSVNKAAQCAYFGGRIEPVRFGNHEGEAYYYDINSAYPYAISQLPGLAHGKWRHSRSQHPKVAPCSLYHVEWDFTAGAGTNLCTEPFYPLPYRRPDGTISYFPKGKGWVHAPEYQLLLDFYPDRFRLLDSWLFTPADDVLPFAWVSEMYARRREWKEAGRGEEKILKLGMNSLYGKMVQQLGWARSSKIPPYHQLEWGGYVTSYTRASLYRAARSAPDAVVGFETDGIISTLPLDVPCGIGLGEWGVTPYGGATYVQPGVYWLHDHGTWTPKHRGFDPGTLSRNDVLTAWREGRRTVAAKSTRFVGMGLALQTNWTTWRRWITSDRELSVWPDNPKRNHGIGPRGCDGICRPDRGPGSRAVVPDPSQQLHLTQLQWDYAGYWTGAESEPYPLQWRPDYGRYTWADMAREFEENQLHSTEMEDID